MLTQHIAVVPEAGAVNASSLARVSAALQKQVTRDLSPAWNLVATVDAFPHLDEVPLGYWPIIITPNTLGGYAGVHIDRHGQPYAMVEATAHWSMNASRACIEMLVNPVEHRTVTAASLRSDQGLVEFLVEACGPCEDPRFAYYVNDVAVADFCTRAYFEPTAVRDERYSFNDSLDAPLRVLPGGHITWYEPVSDTWWLRSHWGDNPIDTQLGTANRKVLSVRELVRACATLRVREGQVARSPLEARLTGGQHASGVRAQRLRALLGGHMQDELDRAFDAVQSSRELAGASGSPAGRLQAQLDGEATELDAAHVQLSDAEVTDDMVEQRQPPVQTRRNQEVDHGSNHAASASTILPPAPASPRTEPTAPNVAQARTAARAPMNSQATDAYSLPGLSLAPVSIAVKDRSAARHGLLLGGGALAAAALITLGWSAGSSNGGASASGASREPRSRVVPPASAPASAPLNMSVLGNPEPPPETPAAAVKSVPPAKRSSVARSLGAALTLPPPSPPAPEAQASDSIEALLDTRR